MIGCVTARDIQRLRSFCTRSAIEIIEVPRVRPERKGPRSSGCSLRRRRVYVLSSWRTPLSTVTFAEVLHEAAHVLLTPPWDTLSSTPEDWILLQVEREIARAMFPEHLRAIVQWQLDTLAPMVVGIGWYGDTLRCLPGYTRSIEWRRGLARGRAVGVLDANNRPTGRLPAWEKMPNRLRETRVVFA